MDARSIGQLDQRIEAEFADPAPQQIVQSRLRDLQPARRLAVIKLISEFDGCRRRDRRLGEWAEREAEPEPPPHGDVETTVRET